MQDIQRQQQHLQVIRPVLINKGQEMPKYYEHLEVILELLFFQLRNYCQA